MTYPFQIPLWMNPFILPLPYLRSWPGSVCVRVVLLLGYSAVAIAQDGPVLVPRTYEVHHADTSIIIDGKGDEEAWIRAEFSAAFIDIEGEKSPPYSTRMKMLWDDEFLYFYAEMEEPHVWGTLKQRDTVIFYNNDFEIFIDPDGDTHEYYEFEMNALNTVWDLLLVKPYRNGGAVVDNWDIHGLRSAVHIEGTLNDPSDTDRGWSVEVAIPWEALAEAAHMPVPPSGAFWRVNFSRVNWDFQLEAGRYSRKKDDQGRYAPEYNWVWSPQQVINMHEPERWGYVYFKPKGSDHTFKIPEGEPVKWHLYALYRELTARNGSLLKAVKSGNKDLPVVTLGGDELRVRLEFHASGWNLMADAPSGAGVHLIREDGKYDFKNH